ncbi:MAG: hypothetical protein JSW03_06235 [Candidatus Eiseniibacteriota bacterium]|nr:MAG: hypothetical protein JSW03_06235 [Candidatus Eisenbacteria bacterium]
MLEQIALGIAHGFNNLHGGIRGYVELALGVAGILRKPVTLGALYASLERAVLQKETSRQETIAR